MTAEREGAARLTAREMDVVELVVEGLTDAEIGKRVHLSERTVHGHVANARRKVDARSRTQLAVIALRTGIVPLHPEAEDELTRQTRARRATRPERPPLIPRARTRTRTAAAREARAA